MPLDPGATNEILPFAFEGSEELGDLEPLASYAAHAMRARGHQPGLALRAIENRALRQVSHVAAGVAQFIANRHAAGVLDNADLDGVEDGLVDAVAAVASEVAGSVANDAVSDHALSRNHPAATTAEYGMVKLVTPEQAGALSSTDGAVSPAALAAFGALSANVLINSSFAIWSFGTTINGTGSASSNWIADGWSISSDADYVARQSTGRPGSDAATAIEIWRIAAGAQNLALQQSVEAADCSGLGAGFTVSGWFFNGLGVAASPSLVVYVPTSGVADDWSAGATNVFANGFGQVAAGQWGYISKAVVPDGWSPSKGVKVAIIVNAAYLTGPTKTYKLAEIKLERGLVPTPYVPPLLAAEVQACRRRVQRVTLHLMTSTASGVTIRTGASLPTVMRRTPDATIITDTSVNCGTPVVYALTDRSVIVSGTSTNSSITRIAVELRLNADV